MLYLPSLNARIIDEGIATGKTGVILHLGAIMLAVSLAQICASVGAAWFGSRTAMSFGRDLRRDLFHRVGTFSAREVNQFGAPSLITRGTNDVQQVQMLVLMACLIAASSPIMMVGGVIMALREDVGLGWILAVVVPALFLAVGFVISRMVPTSASCSPASTRSTGCCASRSPASAWSARSCASPTRPSASARPTPTSPTSRCAPVAGWRRCSRSSWSS